MKNSAALLALATSLFAPLATATPLVARGVNPFQGKTLYPDPLYTSQVQGAVATLQAEGKTALATKAAKVAEGGLSSDVALYFRVSYAPSKSSVPTFIWISQRSEVTKISPILYDAKSKQTSTGKAQAVQLVVYNLPNR
ncbi:hypothetical protein FRC01_009004, partial [Tulasnella sp. 417]